MAATARHLLRGVAGGKLLGLPVAIRFWDGSELRAQGTGLPIIRVRDPRALAYLGYAPGQLGLARAWATGMLEIEGEFEPVVALRERIEALGLTPLDHALLALVALRLAGRSALPPPPIPASEARQAGRLHSLLRDKRAISHHYDVSNRFYRLLLGPTMVYSCAYFESGEESHERAQERKLEAICAKLRLHAARHHEVRGIGVTLSEAQANLARARVREAGLADEIEIRVIDYRLIDDGPYDKISSIGMYEHVGIGHYRAYARKVRSLLRAGGLFLNDGIARLHSTFSRRPSFINRYIFPDGEIHPLSALIAGLEASGLEVRGVESWREHYALTLRCWHRNLTEHREAMIREVGAERTRVWELYILASALAFSQGEVTNYQVLAESS
jgi:cyclopropane-fatty-acyl-phospholipid synthase